MYSKNIANIEHILFHLHLLIILAHLKENTMNRILRKYSWIVFSAFVILLGLQFVILSELYHSEREKYTFLLNNILCRSVSEFNTNKIISDKSKINYIKWGKQDKNVTIIKQGYIFRIPITGKIEKDKIENIGTYDIRESDFEFSMIHFTLENWDKILTILGLSLVLGYCIINLYYSVKTEKRVGKYRELFTHTLVHELKTPVQVIKKDEYLLRKYLAEFMEERTIKLMDTMKQDLEILSQKIDTLLTTMITADGFEINVSFFSLNELLENILEVRQKIAPDNKEIIYCLNCSPEIDIISADPNHLYEALNNLLENAEKYSGERVEITITCRKIKSGIQISVKDNGFGISEEDKKHIFEKNNLISTKKGRI